ncbi:hypothetical protein ES703_120984 [subsurface metagenome]
MKRYKKTFDKEHKVTRILLADYLVLKGISQRTGQSMAETLHTIITRDWAMARSITRIKAPVALPVTAPIAYRAIPTTAYRSGPITTLATNGSKVAAFGIKPKGVSYD